MKLLSKKVTVEQIHKEFDDAEQKTLDACEALLNELNIPTESKIERKGELAEKIGFVNSEIVKKANYYKEKRKQEENKLRLAKETINLINDYKVRYTEKIIPVSELERICEKYNLIHAPIANYVKDIPEKNLIEISEAKKLSDKDNPELVFNFEGNTEFFKFLKEAFGKTENISELEIREKVISIHGRCPEGWDNPTIHSTGLFIISRKCINNYAFYYKCITVDKTGYFIAAPKSHFNLDGISKKSKFGFFNVSVTEEIKDPVVFEYMKGDLVRIITKWGTDDDQSYLDPSLTNEILN